MRNAMFLTAAALALPFFAFGCAVDTTIEDDVQQASEETENTATAEQAITASERVGIGKIFDTGASLGFAEFYASLVNWNAPGPNTQTDYNNMNASINYTIADPWKTLDGTKLAISSASYNPPPVKLLGTDIKQPYATVSSWRAQLYYAIANTSIYVEYYNLGGALAIAEGQASIAPAASQSWQFSCWALDSALHSANLLKSRVQIDVNALSALRNNVCSNKPANAHLSIRSLREQYASAVYSTAEAPICGNGSCQAGESCSSCPQDCGTCIACGDHKCDPGETCSSCVWDCGNSYPVCVDCDASGPGGNTHDFLACSEQAAISYVQSSYPGCAAYAGACF